MQLPSGAPPQNDDFQNDLQAARAGSAEALGRVLERFRPYLLRIANDELDSALRPKVGASDLVQQSLLEGQQDFAGFRGTALDDLQAWLRGILRHNLADVRAAYHEAAKRQLKQEELLDTATAGPLHERLVADTPSPLEHVVADEQVHALQQALGRLTEDYRRVLTLRHQEGLSFVQIGDTLGRSADAVRKLWFRAVEALRQEMQGSHEADCR
jgi:RNA polymerase sigma-70 factor (ECF subfamily)